VKPGKKPILGRLGMNFAVILYLQTNYNQEASEGRFRVTEKERPRAKEEQR
jgi:hypothetical protein